MANPAYRLGSYSAAIPEHSKRRLKPSMVRIHCLQSFAHVADPSISASRHKV